MFVWRHLTFFVGRILPLNEKGEIFIENIKVSANIQNLETQEKITQFIRKFNFSRNFKLKEIIGFENALKTKFRELYIESEKILSRGKCRGFIYILSKEVPNKFIVDDPDFNFLLNCLAIGLENFWLIKTKKSHEHGKHPNSIKNLKPYKKGETGNPGGRPTKYAKLKKALDKWGNEECAYDFWDVPSTATKTMKDQVHWRIWHKAIHGDNKCIEILARLGCLDDD